VRIRYGTGRTQSFTTFDLNQTKYSTGIGVLVRDLNADGFADLVVAHESSIQSEQAPALFFLFGSPDGVDPSKAHQVWAPRVEDFGAAMALVEGVSPLLVVGAPGQVVGGMNNTEDFGGGVLVTYPLGPDGMPNAAPWVYSQNSPGIPGDDEELDAFGSSLASVGSTLVVGVPGKDVGKTFDAGAVDVLEYDGLRLRGSQVTEDTHGVPGSTGRQHYFGRDVAAGDGYVVVGVPGAGSGRLAGTGKVQPFRIDGGELHPMEPVFEDNKGASGVTGARNGFGHTVALTRPCPGVVGVLASSSAEGLHGSREGTVWTMPFETSPTCQPARYRTGEQLAQLADEGAIGCVVAPIRYAGPDDVDGLVVGSCGDGEGIEGYVHILASPASVDAPFDGAIGAPTLSRPPS
jgi:hypothetical protein